MRCQLCSSRHTRSIQQDLVSDGQNTTAYSRPWPASLCSPASSALGPSRRDVRARRNSAAIRLSFDATHAIVATRQRCCALKDGAGKHPAACP
jgi:hypothetical protein